MNVIIQSLSNYLHSYLPGGHLSRDTRHLLLDTLDMCPTDPRVPGTRELVWAAVVDQSVETVRMEGGGLSRYHSGEK